VVVDLFLRGRHIKGVPSLKNSKRKPASAPIENWWEATAEEREIDQLFDWGFYTEAEERSLDHLIEFLRRDREERTAPTMKR
jgi:hypothetical protein